MKNRISLGPTIKQQDKAMARLLSRTEKGTVIFSKVESAARAFAQREGWDWDKLSETDDTSFGWSRNHIRQQIFEIL